MAYRLVIFDLDGTLADSFPWFLRVFDDVADRFGFRRLRDAEIETVRALGLRAILRHFGVPLWKMPRIAAHMRALAAEAELPLFPGVDALFAALHDRGVAIAVVTSNSEANARRLLGDQARRVAHWGCGASLFGKRAKLRRVVRRSGVAPADVICVGDEIRDLEAARAEGLAFGAVTWGYAHPDALAALAPEHLFASVEEIARIA
jgi:phosphoglycolate phosphatase